MSDALETQGVVLKRGDGADPEVFTAVAEVVSFTGPGGSASVIDVSHLGSTRREKRMGLPDEGQFTFEVNYIPTDTSQSGLQSDRAARTLRNFKLILTDDSATELAFSGYVTGFSIAGGVDDKVSGSVTIEITGEVTIS